MTDLLSYTDLPHHAQVFIAPLLTQVDDGQTLLSKPERLRLKEMPLASRQCEFVSGRVLLRLLLSKHMQCSVNEVELSINEQGKPYCPTPQAPFFSISHCAQHVAVALCDKPIGVDIEQVQTKRDITKVALRYFAKSEFNALCRLNSAQDKSDFFYELWGVKEAIAKATGKGLAASLNNIELKKSQQQIQRINSKDEVMQLFSNKIDERTFLALAIQSSEAVQYTINTVTINAQS